MDREQEIKHLEEIMKPEDEEQIHKRLDPIILEWMKKYNYTVYGHYKMKQFLYELARNCYLTGMLIDAVVAQMEIDREKGK